MAKLLFIFTKYAIIKSQSTEEQQSLPISAPAPAPTYLPPAPAAAPAPLPAPAPIFRELNLDTTRIDSLMNSNRAKPTSVKQNLN